MQKAESFLPYLQKQGAGYFEEISEKVSFDRGERFDPEHLSLDMADMMEAACIKNRGVFVTYPSHWQTTVCCIVQSLTIDLHLQVV